MLISAIHIRQIWWTLILELNFAFSGFFPTVYRAVPSRDRAFTAVTETTIVLQLLFRNPLGGLLN